MTLDIFTITPLALMGLGIIGFCYYMIKQTKSSWIYISKEEQKKSKKLPA